MGRVILLLRVISSSLTSTSALHQPQAREVLIGWVATRFFSADIFMINVLYLRCDLRPNQLWCYQGSQSKFKSWTVSLSLSIKTLPHGPDPRVHWSAVIRCNYQSMIEISWERSSANANEAVKLDDLTVIIITCDLWKFKKYWRQFERPWAWWWW